MRNLTRGSLLALSFAIFLIAACSTGTGVSPQTTRSASSAAPPGAIADKDYRYPVDEVGPYNFVWSSADDIDLHSRPAELTRAYIESCALSLYGADAVYPGAADAVAENGPGYIPSCLTPKKYPSSSEPAFYGTIYAHIIELDSNENNMTARVCYSNNGRADVETDEPEYDRLDAVDANLSATLPPGSTDPRAAIARGVSADEKGERAPRFDAFHPWKFEANRWDSASTTTRSTLPLSKRDCHRWAAENLDRVPAFSGQNPFNSDGYLAPLEPKVFGEKGFPTLSQTPLWPSA